MTVRIPWNRYEVALLFSAYERVAAGADINEEAAKLSEALRGLATRRGISIDDIFRNVNGMKMQLANVQYLFTDGKRGLSGASTMIRQMYELYRANQAEYQTILKEAVRMTGNTAMSVADAFFAYAKDRIGLPPKMLVEYLKKAEDYCHLKQPLLSMTDVKAVRNVQQKVSEGKLLRFQYGKDAQTIRNATQLYYKFIKSYREDKAQPVSAAEPKPSVVEEAPVELVSEEIETDNQSVWWTKDSVEQQIDTSDFRCRLDEGFKLFLVSEKRLVQRTAAQYSQSVEAVERFLRENRLDCTLDTADPDEVQQVYDALMAREDFVFWNNQRHHQYSAALAQYVVYLRQDDASAEGPDVGNHMTIKDVAVTILREAGMPLTMPQIMQRIEAQHLYRFYSNNPSLILYQGIRRYCKGMKASNHSPVNVFDRFTDENGQVRYMLLVEEQNPSGDPVVHKELPVDDRWEPILLDSFPDGYILNDFLSQFQAAGFWQEHYGDACPIEGDAIDGAMKAVGTVRDGRVFSKNEENRQLISAICAEITDTLSRYTTVYRASIYDRYQNQLAACQIYTEQVMTQQLLAEAGGSFYSVNQVFAKPGQYASVIQDCRKVLRDHGGAMPVGDVARVLWFIPFDMVYHYLSVDDEALNIGNSVWMLAEHFPLTREDAARVGDMLDECFLSQDFVQAAELMPLMKQRLPSIADNLSGLHFTAVFNILNYHLKNRFSFSRAIIAPKGARTDFRDLFRAFAKEHERFTLDELSAFSSELQSSIYWESTFIGGAVRVSRTEFVHKSQIKFDVDATDKVLESFCTGDYLPLQAVSSAMMMHLHPCGYRWNGYLLLSYVYGFSKEFRLSYNSLGKSGFYGAMVKRSCKKIDSYERLVEQVLTDDDTWQTEDEALGLLVTNGLQAQKRLKGIEQIVAKARENKLSDDDGGELFA